jgi:plasmid stabilization system protein ParE
MAYEVKITSRAERDLALLYERIDAGHSGAALKWYLDLKKNILSLEQHPNRCLVIHKKDRLRHLLFGNKPHVCRVIFRVLEKQKHVEALHIRHGARRRFSEQTRR